MVILVLLLLIYPFSVSEYPNKMGSFDVGFLVVVLFSSFFVAIILWKLMLLMRI
jgi:hypothetical protein